MKLCQQCKFAGKTEPAGTFGKMLVDGRRKRADPEGFDLAHQTEMIQCEGCLSRSLEGELCQDEWCTEEHGKVRPEIWQRIFDPREIGEAESQELRGNSWEQMLLVQKYDDITFVKHVEYCIKNCQKPERGKDQPARDYDEAVKHQLAPQLIERLARANVLLTAYKVTYGGLNKFVSTGRMQSRVPNLANPPKTDNAIHPESGGGAIHPVPGQGAIHPELTCEVCGELPGHESHILGKKYTHDWVSR